MTVRSAITLPTMSVPMEGNPSPGQPRTTLAEIRRRPSGAPPPLPKEAGWLRWAVVFAIVFLIGRRARYRPAFDGRDPIVRPSRPPLVRRPPDGRLHEPGQGAVPAHEPRRRPHGAMGRRHRPRGRRPVPSHGRVPRDVRDLRLAGGAGAVRADAASRGAGAGRPRGPTRSRPGPSPPWSSRWSRWCSSSCRAGPTRRWVRVGIHLLHRVRSHPGPLPRRRLPGPEPVRVGPGGRRGPARVPVAGARRRLPRDVPQGRQRGAPRPGRRARRRHRERDARPARPGGHRGRAVRPGRVRRVVAAADDPGGRIAHVREDLLDLARPRGPLVPDRPDDPLRATRGRDADRLGPATGHPRGLRAAVPA